MQQKGLGFTHRYKANKKKVGTDVPQCCSFDKSWK
jgi:hypothetical protein